MKQIDVAIIGAGTAGINAHNAAMRAGANAVMFDPGPLGTTCARVGCMPSKLLIAAAEHARSAKVAAAFGVKVGAVQIDGKAVMTRLQTMRDRFVDHTLEGLERVESRGGLVRAAVELESANSFVAGSEHYQTSSFVIATGSRPWVPPPYRQLGDRLLSTDQIFELPTLPESLLVVGAGIIGIELALAFVNLGVRVTVVELDGNLAGLTDPEVRAAAYTIFSEELNLSTSYQLQSVTRENDRVRIAFVDDDGKSRDESFEFALVVTGRRPQLEGLGLEKAGLGNLVDLGARVDPTTGQIADSAFFMAGDVSGRRALLHEAGFEGRLAGQNAARYPESPMPAERMTPLGIVFSDPQIATVGMAFDALPEGVVIGEIDFAAQARAKMLGRAKGRMRLYANPGDGKLLGATVLGPDAEYVGHLLAWSIQNGLTAKEAIGQPFYHPTIVESIQTALRQILKKL